MNKQKLDIDFFIRCTNTLQKALSLLLQENPENIEYDIYKSACIKEFEIILEQSAKLIRKCLKPYFSSAREVDALTFKDVFRRAAHHGIISLSLCERFLGYRDHRNSTAHEYGVNFAEEILSILPSFVEDARLLAVAIESQNHDH